MRGPCATLRQMLAGVPRAPVRMPSAVNAVAAGETVWPVWENEAAGLTFAIGTLRRSFIKWAPPGSGID